MAKKNNNIPKKPRIEAPTENAETTTPKISQSIEVVDINKVLQEAKKPLMSGLDANHRVDLAKLGHEIFGKDPDASTKYGERTVAAMNHLVAIQVMAETVTESIVGQSPFALTVRRGYITELNEIASSIGLTVDQKLLPATAGDQNEVVEIPNTAFVPSKEVEEQIKKEEEIRSTTKTYDPTKIETEEELKEALEYLLNESMSPYQNMSKAVNFYTSYLKVKASKSKDKDNELTKINELTFAHVLDTILSLVSTVPFATRKIADNMRTTTGSSKSVIPAFCTMRDATKNRKTGIPAITDPVIADIVKVLVNYSANLAIVDKTRFIAEKEKDLVVLKKDAEKNAKGIASVEESIETIKNSIEYLKGIIDIVYHPTVESIEHLISQYEDKNDQNHSAASRSFSQIVRSYYGSVDTKKVNQELLKKNVEQYAGVITNYFRDPLSQLINYNKNNIVELETSVEAVDKGEPEIKK